MPARTHNLMTANAEGVVERTTVNNPSVVVNPSQGEHLFYQVAVEGANPAWIFSCEDRQVIRMSTTEPGHPKSVYEWVMNGDDFDSPNDTYVLTMIFGPATQFHVITEHRDGAGNAIQVLTDLVFAGGGDGDFAVEELRVFVV